MRILTLHNHYQQPGGEDHVFFGETSLLERNGHTVLKYTMHNDAASNMNPMTLARRTVWNEEVHREVSSLCRTERPEVAHFHNTFPLISPAAYYAVRAAGIPIIQSLHNYRLLCPNALFYRDGHICEDCLGKSVPWPGLVHACYRDSRAATGVVGALLTTHRVLKTWHRLVDVFIAPTDFVRQKYIEGGFPSEKIVVKPHFVYPDPGTGEHAGNYALFVGRLTVEKGVRTLLRAWTNLCPAIPLKIVGDGPLGQEVSAAVKDLPGVEWLGQQSKDQVVRLMQEAQFLIVPSEWYEPFGMVITEGYAAGLPVIASNLAGMQTLIRHGHTGMHFTPGDPDDLAAQVAWLWSHPAELSQMRRAARQEFEVHYTVARNYEQFMAIYEQVRQREQVGR